MQTTHYSHDTRTPTPPRISSSRNPTGQRIETAAMAAARTAAAHFAGLEAHAHRFEIIHLLRQAGPHCGWRSNDVDFLERLIVTTPAKDWTPGRRPIVWRSLTDMAAERGVSPDTVRRLEQRLVALGAMVWRDSGNHARFAVRDREGNVIDAYGLDLSPAAALVPGLRRVKAAAEAERCERKHLTTALSAACCQAGASIEHARRAGVIEAHAADAFRDELERLRAIRVTDQSTPIAEAEANLERIAAIADGVRALMNAKEPGGAAHGGSNDEAIVDNSPAAVDKLWEETASACNSASPPSQNCEPLLLQATETPKQKEVIPPRSKNDRPNAAPAPKPVTNNRQDEVVGVPSLEVVLDIVPRWMSATLPDGQCRSWRALGEAAGHAARRLGISPHALAEAREHLGDEGAGAAVSLIAGKHARGLIERPGGYLRELVRRSQTGELHLARSLYGLFHDTQREFPHG